MTEQNSTASDQASGANQAAAAVYLDISQPRVAQFVRDGTFRKLANGKLDLNQCRVAYIRWLRDETRKSSTSAAATRLADERAEEIRLRRMERQQVLIKQAQEEALHVIDTGLGPLKGDLYGIPPQVTNDLKLRRAIEDRIDIALNAAADRANRAATLAEQKIGAAKKKPARKRRRALATEKRA